MLLLGQYGTKPMLCLVSVSRPPGVVWLQEPPSGQLIRRQPGVSYYLWAIDGFG